VSSANCATAARGSEPSVARVPVGHESGVPGPGTGRGRGRNLASWHGRPQVGVAVARPPLRVFASWCAQGAGHGVPWFVDFRLRGRSFPGALSFSVRRRWCTGRDGLGSYCYSCAMGTQDGSIGPEDRGGVGAAILRRGTVGHRSVSRWPDLRSGRGQPVHPAQGPRAPGFRGSGGVRTLLSIRHSSAARSRRAQASAAAGSGSRAAGSPGV